jgi:hypothetical protein
MIVQPNTFKCKIQLEHVLPDESIPEKFHLSGKIVSAEKSAKNNSFYKKGLLINGFTFNLSEGFKAGDTIFADVTFMGSPSVQNYQLENIEIAT